jgi:hypothetical protein
MPESQKIEDDVKDLLPTFGSLQRFEDVVNILLAVRNALVGHKNFHVKFPDLTLCLGCGDDLEFIPNPTA